MHSMLQMDKYKHDTLLNGIVETIAQSTPVMELIDFIDIAGNSLSYNVEDGIAGVGFRGYNASLNESNSVINPQTETLKILQGKTSVDRAALKTRVDKEGYKAHQLKNKTKSLGYEFTRAFFLGDSAVDPNEFDGLKTRLTGSQVIDHNATLTLAGLDKLIFAVAGPNSKKTIFMNNDNYLTFLGLVDAKGNSIVSPGQDNFGEEIIKYRNVPIRVIEQYPIVKQDPADPTKVVSETVDILGLVEDTNTTSSIYCVAFGQGEENVSGIQNESGIVKYEYTEGASEVIDVEWIAGFGVFSPKAAARLKRVK